VKAFDEWVLTQKGRLGNLGFVGSQRRKDAKDAEALRFWEKGRKD
jgi:hypothetical protein